MDVREEISKECDGIKEMLLAKNDAYGDSAINPIHIFSKLDSIEALNARLDDKLARIRKIGNNMIGEDTIKDIIGYLILRRIAERNRHGGN